MLCNLCYLGSGKLAHHRGRHIRGPPAITNALAPTSSDNTTEGYDVQTLARHDSDIAPPPSMGTNTIYYYCRGCVCPEMKPIKREGHAGRHRKTKPTNTDTDIYCKPCETVTPSQSGESAPKRQRVSTPHKPCGRPQRITDTTSLQHTPRPRRTNKQWVENNIGYQAALLRAIAESRLTANEDSDFYQRRATAYVLINMRRLVLI